MSKVKSSKINYATPGNALDQQEFEKMIKKAENGPFHSMEAVKAEFEKWNVIHRNDL